MSFYSQFVNIRYLEPHHHNQHNRTEWKLPDDIVAYPNLRLCNVGLNGAIGSLSKMGCVSLIRHVSLYSDRELIDTLRYANQWHSFNQLTESNAANKDVNSVLEKSKIGYTIDSSAQSISKDSENAVTVAADETKGSGGFVQLPKLLKFLQSDGLVLDTSKLKNLRVVVEWETNKLKYLDSGTNNNFNIPQPTLIYDEIENPQIAAQLSAQVGNLTWSCMEHDAFDAPAIKNSGTGHQQALNRRLKGFDNKFVSRMLIQKNFVNPGLIGKPGNLVSGKGWYRSPVQHKEQVNLKVNSKPLFSENLDNDAIKSYMTKETWGALNLQFYEDQLSAGVDNPVDGNLNFIGVPANKDEFVGYASYVGCVVNNRIKDLEVHYSRVNPQDSTAAIKRYGEHLNINVWGEVAKQLIMGKNGEFTVRYL